VRCDIGAWVHVPVVDVARTPEHTQSMGVVFGVFSVKAGAADFAELLFHRFKRLRDWLVVQFGLFQHLQQPPDGLLQFVQVLFGNVLKIHQSVTFCS